MPKSVCRPSWSRDLQSGMHSMTPHCRDARSFVVTSLVKTYEIPECTGVSSLTTYSWSRGHHPVRKHVEVQPHQLEDVFKEADDLKSQHVLGRHRSHSKHTRSDTGAAKEPSCGRGSDLSAVISHFKDGRLPADPLGLLFTFHLVFRICAALQT